MDNLESRFDANMESVPEDQQEEAKLNSQDQSARAQENCKRVDY